MDAYEPPANDLNGVPKYTSSIFERDPSIHKWFFLLFLRKFDFGVVAGWLTDACEARGSAGAVPGSGLRLRVPDATIPWSS